MTKLLLKYRPSVHAIERLRDYFGTSELHAMDYANELMQGAQLVETQKASGRRVFKSVVEDVMLVIGGDNVVVTVLPPAGKGQNNAYAAQMPSNERLSSVIVATVRRELAKAKRAYTKETRMMTEEIAHLGLEIAQLTLNKARARSPITQKHITDKVSQVHAAQTELAARRKEVETEYTALREEADALIGGMAQ